MGLCEGTVFQYTYDAWSNVLSTTGSYASTLGQQNPLRYRGYVYDQETGLYYLQSRYYNPEVGRFINADAFVSTGQGLLGNNMFAYCNNSPVRHADYTGQVLTEVTVTTAGTVVAITVCGILIVYYGAKLISEFFGWLSQQWYYSYAQISVNYAEPTVPDVTYPGDNPELAPEGTEWKGKGEPGSKQGNYHNPETGESWHPDLDHPDPVGPHWDYKDPSGIWWRVFPESVCLK